MRITMEFFQVATIRDWIIEVCNLFQESQPNLFVLTVEIGSLFYFCYSRNDIRVPKSAKYQRKPPCSAHSLGRWNWFPRRSQVPAFVFRTCLSNQKGVQTFIYHRGVASKVLPNLFSSVCIWCHRRKPKVCSKLNVFMFWQYSVLSPMPLYAFTVYQEHTTESCWPSLQLLPLKNTHTHPTECRGT